MLRVCVLLALLLASCAQTAGDTAPPLETPQQIAASTPAPLSTLATPTETVLPRASATTVNSATPTKTATIPALPVELPSATPNPFEEYTVEALAAREYGGGALSLEETLERNDQFTRYLISYPSDGLRIAGFMNVPHEGREFPVAIVLHGYVPPTEYETLAYTQRYADALAEAGYFVIHPNLRNYPPSDSGSNMFRSGMAIDVLNLIAIIKEQSKDKTGPLRRAKADDIHLWGHSMGGGVALRVATVNNDDAIKTAVLYAAMSGDERLNYGRILEWSEGRRGEAELAVPQEMLAAISPINHLERVRAAISIHHSDADDVVPFAWSEDLCRRLQGIDHPVECFTYNGAPHTFHGVWDEVFIERFISFFDRH